MCQLFARGVASGRLFACIMLVVLGASACGTTATQLRTYEEQYPESRAKQFVASGSAKAAGAAIVFNAFDFLPQPGGHDHYDIKWPGAPTQPLHWNNVTFYVPSVSLTAPAPTDVTLCFWIKDDVSMWWDTTLGTFCVTIHKGATRPTAPADIKAPTGDAPPAGAPNFHSGAFWLGCTKKGKIKGSESKNGQDADVYIESFEVLSTGVPLTWKTTASQSPRHRVQCLFTVPVTPIPTQ